ncbi:MAG TPA: hypothetical protein VII08_19180 [Myxococcales bacterium]
MKPTAKPGLKSLPDEEAQGKVHPPRRAMPIGWLLREGWRRARPGLTTAPGPGG